MIVLFVGELGFKEENVDIEGFDFVFLVFVLIFYVGIGFVNFFVCCLCIFIIFSDDVIFEEWFF